MEGLQPLCSAGLLIIARCCKSYSCEKSPFLSCCWLRHCTPFSSALPWLWLHGVQMQQLFTFWHQKSQDVSCCKCALSACLIVAWRVEGKAQGLSLESYPENGPEHLNLCLATRVFPAHGSVVWNDGIVDVKNDTAEHEWLSDCGCTVLVEDNSRADESTACLCLVRGGQRALPVIFTGGHGAVKAPCSLEGAAEVLKPLRPITYMHPGGSWDFANGCVLLWSGAILIALVMWSASCAE